MQTSIAKFKNDKTGQFSYSIEDLGIPKMFGEILPMMFKIMALEKELGKFFPNQNLRDMFTNVIFDRIKNQNSRNDLMKLARSFDISMFGITTDKITRIIDDINNSFLDSKTRIQSPEERCRNVMMLFGVGVDNSNGAIGGCPIGKDVSTGVVNSFGNVFRRGLNNQTYDGLYVVDGSVIPSALGVNPSLTISALAFRSAEHITNSLIEKFHTGDDAKQFWPG